MIASHACGASWVQRGSQTGHCCACHLTFASERAFEQHRFDTPNGGRGCADPADRRLRDGSPAFTRKHDGHGIVWSEALYGARARRPDHWVREQGPSGTPTALPLARVPDIPQGDQEGQCSRSLGVCGELLPV